MSDAVEPIWKTLEKAGHVQEAEKVKRRWIMARIERMVEDLKCGTR